jgi:hypothetical protein
MERGHFVTIAVITRQIPGRIIRVGNLGIGLRCSYGRTVNLAVNSPSLAEASWAKTAASRGSSRSVRCLNAAMDSGVYGRRFFFLEEEGVSL